MEKDSTRCTGHERVKYWNMIAEKDKTIDDLKWEHARELAEKNELIRYYAKVAETATDRKKAAIRNAERRAKLNLSYAALLITAMCVIPWVLWLCDGAMKAFWLWANQ